VTATETKGNTMLASRRPSRLDHDQAMALCHRSPCPLTDHENNICNIIAGSCAGSEAVEIVHYKEFLDILRRHGGS
jgi:hypothetical protein